jgi:hypothetical protein
MDASMTQFVVNLLTQLPMFIVFGVGVNMARARWTHQPQAARLTCLAIAILFVMAVGMTAVYTWLPHYGLAQGWSGPTLQKIFVRIGILRHIIEAVALALFLRAIFTSPVPALAQPAPARRRGCLGLLLGGLLGAAGGVVLALVLAEPIAVAFNISTFEGERGFFVMFLLVLLCAIAGAVAGVALVLVLRGRHRLVS